MKENEAYSATILLVEDDVNLGFVIRDNLEHRGFKVTLCGDGESGSQAFSKQAFDLCILDVMLPVKDGFTLAREIRESDKDIPILFLTARSMKDDRITGFNAGADDYITKPFSIEELEMRIRVFLKRSGKSNREAAGKIRIGNAVFDKQNFELMCGEVHKKLTSREAALLTILCEHMGTTVKREEILNRVWGNDDYFAGRSMDVFISKLRKYFAPDPRIEIMNYHGVGFRLVVK